MTLFLRAQKVWGQLSDNIDNLRRLKCLWRRLHRFPSKHVWKANFFCRNILLAHMQKGGHFWEGILWSWCWLLLCWCWCCSYQCLCWGWWWRWWTWTSLNSGCFDVDVNHVNVSIFKGEKLLWVFWCWYWWWWWRLWDGHFRTGCHGCFDVDVNHVNVNIFCDADVHIDDDDEDYGANIFGQGVTGVLIPFIISWSALSASLCTDGPHLRRILTTPPSPLSSCHQNFTCFRSWNEILSLPPLHTENTPIALVIFHRGRHQNFQIKIYKSRLRTYILIAPLQPLSRLVIKT